MTTNFSPNQNTKSKVFLDDDGKEISKNAFKRLQKEKIKAQKAALKTLPEQDSDNYKYFENRMAAVQNLKKEGANPYPHVFDTLLDGKDISMSLPQFLKCFKNIGKNEKLEGRTACLMGRIRLIRKHGASLYFAVIEGDDAQVQIFLSNLFYKEKKEFGALVERLHRGDIVGVRGFPGRTKAGELSIYASSVEILAPCLRMLPSFKYGFKEQEQRYRQRYLDFILNPEHRRIFHTRAKIISYLRRFLDERGFLEVETPILSPQAGGANARPFSTFHNDLAQQMFLRVAPELRLKELVVGGLSRVYEIGRQFRNEGIDPTHNPEFTTCEFYWAFRDYEALMAETEALLEGMVAALNGRPSVSFQPRGQSPIEIDFSAPYKRVDFVEGIEAAAGFKIPRPLDSEETRRFLAERVAEAGLAMPSPPTAAKLLDKLCGHYVEDRLVQPTFVVNHPAIISPLAKAHRSRPELTERFELFVCGKELCNAFTELNDPAVQRERFLAQARDRQMGDDESMEVDEGFVLALEHGLPPTAGWGFGIDRFAMFMTNTANIKEVLLFPAMRPIGDNTADSANKDE